MGCIDRELEAERLVEHEGLAVSLARRFGLDDPDGHQAARIGILRASRGFDPGRGYRFSTYAAYWVRAELERERAARGPVSINSTALEERRRVQAARERVGAATVEELASATSVSQMKVRAFEQLVSLTPRMLWGRGPGRLQLQESMAADELGVEELVELPRLWARVLEGLDELARVHPRWARVIRGRLEEMILVDLAAELDISPERVRQLERQGHRWLRRWLGV